MNEILAHLVGKTISKIDSTTVFDTTGDVYTDWVKVEFTDGSHAILRAFPWGGNDDQAGIEIELVRDSGRLLCGRSETLSSGNAWNR